MSRSFCNSFATEIAPHMVDADIRFRKPNEERQEQCRLGMPREKTRVKGIDYPTIQIIQEATEEGVYLALKCPHIGEKGECDNGGWCSQLQYGDISTFRAKKD